MSWILGKRPGSSFFRRRRFRPGLVRDKTAQIHVMETVIGGLFLLASIIVAIDINTNITQKDTGVNQLGILGEDTLRSLASLPPDIANASDYQNSTLIYYCVTGQVDGLSNFFNRSFESTVSYSFKLFSYQFGGPKNVVFSYSTSLHVMSDSASSHRILSHDGVIYDFQLILWFEPREVSS